LERLVASIGLLTFGYHILSSHIHKCDAINARLLFYSIPIPFRRYMDRLYTKIYFEVSVLGYSPIELSTATRKETMVFGSWIEEKFRVKILSFHSLPLGWYLFGRI